MRFWLGASLTGLVNSIRAESHNGGEHQKLQWWPPAAGPGGSPTLPVVGGRWHDQVLALELLHMGVHLQNSSRSSSSMTLETVCPSCQMHLSFSLAQPVTWGVSWQMIDLFARIRMCVCVFMCVCYSAFQINISLNRKDPSCR